MLFLSLEQFLSFAIASLVCIIAPGTDNLSVLSLGLARGRQAGMGFALGCGLGCLTHTTWATLGVAAIVATSELAFQMLKFAGATYLCYIGVKVLRSKGIDHNSDAVTDFSSKPVLREPVLREFILRGLISNAINPKVALFFLAFLPQFINQQGNISIQLAILGICFSLMTILIFVTLGYFSGAIGSWLRTRKNVSVWLNRLTGILFIGLGIRLVLSQQ